MPELAEIRVGPVDVAVERQKLEIRPEPLADGALLARGEPFPERIEPDVDVAAVGHLVLSRKEVVDELRPELHFEPENPLVREPVLYHLAEKASGGHVDLPARDDFAVQLDQLVREVWARLVKLVRRIDVQKRPGHHLWVVVVDLELQLRQVCGRKEVLVGVLLVVDLARDDADVFRREPLRIRPRLEIPDQVGRNKVVVGDGPESVVVEGRNQLHNGLGVQFAESSELFGPRQRHVDAELGHDLGVLRFRLVDGFRLGNGGVGEKHHLLDDLAGIRVVQLVRELEKHRVSARREARDGDALGVAAKMPDILVGPLDGHALVPEPKVRQLRVLAQELVTRQEAKDVETVPDTHQDELLVEFRVVKQVVGVEKLRTWTSVLQPPAVDVDEHRPPGFGFILVRGRHPDVHVLDIFVAGRLHVPE